jgi:hypothetical protein
VRINRHNPSDIMLEATRLTASGQVGEATALLQSIGLPLRQGGAERRVWRIPGVLRDLFGRATPFAPVKPAGPMQEPEPDPGAGQFLLRSYRNRAGTRAYRLYVPSGYRGARQPWW